MSLIRDRLCSLLALFACSAFLACSALFCLALLCFACLLALLRLFFCSAFACSRACLLAGLLTRLLARLHCSLACLLCLFAQGLRVCLLAGLPNSLLALLLAFYQVPGSFLFLLAGRVAYSCGWLLACWFAGWLALLCLARFVLRCLACSAMPAYLLLFAGLLACPLPGDRHCRLMKHLRHLQQSSTRLMALPRILCRYQVLAPGIYLGMPCVVHPMRGGTSKSSLGESHTTINTIVVLDIEREASSIRYR